MSSIASTTTRSSPGTTTNAPSFSPFSASPAPIPSKWWTTSRRLLPEFRKEIPPAVHLSIAFDASQSIRGSIHDVEFTLVLTIAVVVLVIFLFLRNLSATLIPGCAVPFSIVGTFAVMYLLGYSLNNLSLMALTLSVGFVVDDAIVMLENIVRHMEMGETRLEAAISASRRSASRFSP